MKSNSTPPPYEQKAFTLSEVLITLAIIGIIAAITVPLLYNSYKWNQYRSGVWKAKSVLDNAANDFYVQEGYNASCGYYVPRPYGRAVCKKYSDDGKCQQYVMEGTDNPVPSDYNGVDDECNLLFSSFLKNMNVVKYCESNAYENGCIPEYEGIDTAYKKMNNSSDYEANQAVSGCPGFYKENIKNGSAFVTADGMIFIPYGNSAKAKIMAFDVNGQKGPNKWGQDLHLLNATKTDYNSGINYKPWFCRELLEPGGKDTGKLLAGE